MAETSIRSGGPDRDLFPILAARERQHARNHQPRPQLTLDDHLPPSIDEVPVSNENQNRMVFSQSSRATGAVIWNASIRATSTSRPEFISVKKIRGIPKVFLPERTFLAIESLLWRRPRLPGK